MWLGVFVLLLCFFSFLFSGRGLLLRLSVGNCYTGKIVSICGTKFRGRQKNSDVYYFELAE